MNHLIRVYLRPCEGALIRTLGLAERRGFKLLSCHLTEHSNERQRLDLTVFALDLSALTLRRQLERLHDVLEVTCFSISESSTQMTQPAMVGAGGGR